MKIVSTMILTITFYLFGTVLSAEAHHGWGGYSQSLEMSATIVEIDLGNPHDILIVKDSDGKMWRLLLAPPARNRRFGFGPGSVEVGQAVKLIGERHPEVREAKIHQIWHDEQMVYEYMYGRGRTSLQRMSREK